MKKKGKKRKCPYCKKLFYPNPRSQHSQEYCSDSPECKKESNRVASARYRQKHRDDQDKKIRESERVKRWQREHPDYWKRRKKKPK